MFLNRCHFLSFLLLCISIANAAPVVLYNGSGSETPQMDAATRTWPEPPEYYANWGVLDGMEMYRLLAKTRVKNFTCQLYRLPISSQNPKAA